MERMARGDVGAPLPLTGRYAVQGAQVRAGLELWARHTGARLVLLDDCSDPRQAARLHEDLVAGGCRFVLGPYGSDSTRAVARARAGRVVWNHGAAADDVQRLPGVVSVPSPASRYLVAIGRAVARLSPGAHVAVEAAPGRFARFASEALQREATVLGLRLVPKPTKADAVLYCGPLRRRGPGLLLGGVSPGLAAFAQLLGDDPEGLLAPVQWHPDLRVKSELGPVTIGLEDYVAAQGYAACLIAERCVELEPTNPLAAARRLRTTTFFGGFELGPDGLQVGHHLSAVQWREGRRELLLADAA
jgi:ABC-type branched-subunit amino acid transport system substrate-binding protein